MVEVVPEKIPYKAGALKNILIEIPLWPSVAENMYIGIFFGISIVIFSSVCGIQYMFCGTSSIICQDSQKGL